MDNTPEQVQEHVQEQVQEYQRPNVVDYGTLVEMTAAGTLMNSDVPHGIGPNAFS